MRIPANRVLALSFLTIGLGLSSCTTVDPYTGEQKVSKTAMGTGVGAAGGAILGAVIGNNVGDGDSGRGAAIGAAVGGLAGGGVGNYMDRQEAAIRAQLQGTGVSVRRQGNNLLLVMPHDITYETGQDVLRPGFYPVLNSVAMVLNKFDQTLVTVSGHTDSDGSDAFNQDLSERRASGVSNHLAQKGVNPRRLVTRGFGESYPVAANTTAEGKARNRRVEIQIVPQQQARPQPQQRW